MKFLRHILLLVLTAATLFAQRNDFVNAYRSATPGNMLGASLGAYYKFDEASGNATDSSGNGLNLTQVGTMGTAAGKILTSRSFDTSGASYFTRADNAVFEIGTGSFTIGLWVYIAAIPGDGEFQAIIFKGDSSDWSYQINVFNDTGVSGFQFLTTFDGSTFDGIFPPQVNVGLEINTWYCVVARVDADSLQYAIDARKPGGSWFEDAEDLFGGEVWENSIGLSFGVTLDNMGMVTGDSMESSNRIEETGFWDRFWSNCERDKFFEGGTGRAMATFDSSPCL